MKLKAIAAATLIATGLVSTNAFADPEIKVDISSYRSPGSLSELEMEDFDISVLAAAINTAELNASINLSAEKINIGATASSSATATADVTAGEAAEAVATAINGNTFKTLGLGAQNIANISSIADEAFIEFGSYDVSGSGGEVSTNMDDEIGILSLAYNQAEINASVNLNAAFDEQRVVTAGLFANLFSVTALNPSWQSTIDATNLSISTTVLGASNNTTVNLTSALASFKPENIVID
jgi:hypothetical protein